MYNLKQEINHILQNQSPEHALVFLEVVLDDPSEPKERKELAKHLHQKIST